MKKTITVKGMVGREDELAKTSRKRRTISMERFVNLVQNVARAFKKNPDAISAEAREMLKEEGYCIKKGAKKENFSEVHTKEEFFLHQHTMYPLKASSPTRCLFLLLSAKHTSISLAMYFFRKLFCLALCFLQTQNIRIFLTISAQLSFLWMARKPFTFHEMSFMETA
ncbi:MAG: hypothetical protein AAB552_02500 [Patescibacteria group bacterium]